MKTIISLIRRLAGLILDLLSIRYWVSIETRRPDYDKPVLVISKAWPEHISAAILRYEDGWHWEEYSGMGYLTDESAYEFDDDYEYTHWQYMPKTLKNQK